MMITNNHNAERYQRFDYLGHFWCILPPPDASHGTWGEYYALQISFLVSSLQRIQ